MLFIYEFSNSDSGFSVIHIINDKLYLVKLIFFILEIQAEIPFYKKFYEFIFLEGRGETIAYCIHREGGYDCYIGTWEMYLKTS